MKEEMPDTYRIPVNYKNPGRWRNIPIPNLIEGIIVGFIVEYFLMKIPFTFQARMVVLIISFSAIILIFTRGINGERISIFVLSFLYFVFKLITSRYKYHWQKVGVEDVQSFKDRDSHRGRETNLTKTIRKIKEITPHQKSKTGR